MNPDNKQAIELACSMVYEKLTGKYWHIEHHGQLYDSDGRWEGVVWACTCGKVGYWIINEYPFDHYKCINPPLATSLDAWRPIWEGMSDEQLFEYGELLMEASNYCLYDWMCEPIHHLEAALRASGLYEQWERECEG